MFMAQRQLVFDVKNWLTTLRSVNKLCSTVTIKLLINVIHYVCEKLAQKKKLTNRTYI